MDFPRPFQAGEIAALIKGEIIGNPERQATGLNELHIVRHGDVSFVDHKKYFKKTLYSDASVVIINQETEVPEGKTLILHKAPFDAFMQLINHFRPFTVAGKLISPSAKIGAGTIIQPGAFIGNDVIIGKDCLIHANTSIYNNCVIGDRVVIHSNAVIGADGYYFQRRDHGYIKFQSGGRVVLEDDVEIGALCSIDKGVTGDTLIGKGTKMDNHCQVGHDTIIGKNCLIGAYSAIAGVAKIEDDVILWARVSIAKDLIIGKGAILLATAGTEKSLEGDKVYMGIPAVEVRQYWRQSSSLKDLPDLIKKLRTDGHI